MDGKIIDLIDEVDAMLSKQTDAGRAQLRLSKVRVAATKLLEENDKLRESLGKVQKEHYDALKRLQKIDELARVETIVEQPLSKPIPKESGNGRR